MTDFFLSPCYPYLTANQLPDDLKGDQFFREDFELPQDRLVVWAIAFATGYRTAVRDGGERDVLAALDDLCKQLKANLRRPWWKRLAQPPVWLLSGVPASLPHRSRSVCDGGRKLAL